VSAQRLSVRRGKRPPTGPFDGVPDHLVHPLINWVRIYLYGPSGLQFLQYLSLHLQLVVSPDAGAPELLNNLLNSCVQDPDLLLDLLDAMIGRCPIDTEMREELGALLTIGESVWTLAPDQRSLVERVGDTAIRQFEDVTTPADVASAEMKEAWAKAYGRGPNASDAWDHAIKAVEEILIPIVCPRKDKANLGDVAGSLKAQPERWKLLLQSNGPISSVETMEAMLRLLWPNPDRHGGAKRRTPELAEAQAAVQLAVTIVQWARTGLLEKSWGPGLDPARGR
jgi:hypothetical protein